MWNFRAYNQSCTGFLRVYSGIHKYHDGHLISLVHQAAVPLDFSLNGEDSHKKAVLLVEDPFSLTQGQIDVLIVENNFSSYICV